MSNSYDKSAVLAVLDEILELELAGVIRYTHYSLMIFGNSRIPIVKWFKEQALESLDHAHRVGELITHLDGHPSLGIGALLETHKHSIVDILRESLEHEKGGVNCYKKLHDLVKDKSILLEEYARQMIVEEEMHIGEVAKMLRNPADMKD